jgi:MYXO-CTERM domain-containing protein
MKKRWWTAAVLAAGTAGAVGAPDAQAFCGFYVSGAETKLTNNATQVVLMRDGTRTVLSMQNNYQGPPQDFAMVVPVPVVLQKENVKTLARGVFDHIDQLTAPRLVEYWEQDPCPRPMLSAHGLGGVSFASGAGMGAGGASGAPLPAVRVEAQFSVGEYDIVVLSATDATALDTWLHTNGYKIPAGAEPYLRPYVQMGMKFFVAKVDVSKVTFERVGNGPEQAILSPLRFHYDSDAFNLPIRLGLINSGGTQDLVVTILARNQRYEVANYDNVAIPTNIDVSNATRREFGAFYTTLFDQTLAKHPHAVVTEYSWSSATCDPCPTPPLGAREIQTLGADVIADHPTSGFVITRLHARYSKDALGDDLFFRAAPPIVGGREFMQSGAGGGKLERGARSDAQNNFQARYVIRHPWTGPIACKDPQRGIWGGPPSGNEPSIHPAARIGFLPRAGAVTMSSFVRGALPPETFLSGGGATPVLSIPATPPPVDLDAGLLDGAVIVDAAPVVEPPPPPPSPVPPTPPPQGGCAGCSSAPGGADVAAAGLLVLGFVLMTRRKR